MCDWGMVLCERKGLRARGVEDVSESLQALGGPLRSCGVVATAGLSEPRRWRSSWRALGPPAIAAGYVAFRRFRRGRRAKVLPMGEPRRQPPVGNACGEGGLKRGESALHLTHYCVGRARWRKAPRSLCVNMPHPLTSSANHAMAIMGRAIVRASHASYEHGMISKGAVGLLVRRPIPKPRVVAAVSAFGVAALGGALVAVRPWRGRARSPLCKRWCCPPPHLCTS